MEINWYNINTHQDMINLPEEVWVTCPVAKEYFNESKYEVSNLGRYRINFKGKTKVIKLSDNGNGYIKVALCYNHRQKNFYIHRLVAKAFIPNPENLPQVNHKNTGLGKFDNRVEHLEWCTGKDNIIDAHVNGQMNNRTKVNTSIEIKPKEFIEAMYRRYKDTNKVGETAREFGVSRTTLSSIVNKRSRVDITDKIDLEYD